MSRKAISWKTKYAAALRLIGVIPYEHAKAMHEDQMIALFEAHHDIQHGLTANDHHSNITPMLRPEHKARFAADNRAVKKTKKIERKHAEHKNRMAAPQHMAAPEPERRPKARIANRPFPKRPETRRSHLAAAGRIPQPPRRTGHE